jgi:histidine phosphotransfer protein HptB
MSLIQTRPAIDLDRIRDAADGDDAFLRQLVEVFLDDAGTKVEQLAAAIAAGDAAGVGRMAHQLKGSSSNIGADGLHELARQLETFGRNNAISNARVIYPGLVEEFARVRTELRTLVR